MKHLKRLGNESLAVGFVNQPLVREKNILLSSDYSLWVVLFCVKLLTKLWSILLQTSRTHGAKPSVEFMAIFVVIVPGER